MLFGSRTTQGMLGAGAEMDCAELDESARFAFQPWRIRVDSEREVVLRRPSKLANLGLLALNSFWPQKTQHAAGSKLANLPRRRASTPPEAERGRGNR